MEKFVIIDGNSLINRAFYALPMLANFDGVVSNAVFGFTNILVKVINEVKPKYICVAFDYGKKTFRHEMYKDYKGTRKETPRELKLQFPILKTILNAMNIKLIEKEGIEADDIIGTLTKKFDVQNIVVTGDKDSFQLINKNTTVMFTKKGVSETEDLNPQKLQEVYGFSADQVIELKALMGDPSDNIPGVSGVGEKTALSLLQKYNTLDGVYKNINNITGKLQERLIQDKEVAYLSKQLATIKCDEEFDVKLSDFTYDFPFSTEVLDLFKKYQFNSLIKREDLYIKTAETDNESAELEEENLSLKKVVVKNEQQIATVIDKINKHKKFSIVYDQTVNIGVNNTEYEFSFELDLFNAGLDVEQTLQLLAPVFSNPEIKKVAFDHKYIMHKLHDYGIEFCGVEFDVVIARYLINNNAKSNVNIMDVLIEQNLNEKYPALSLFTLQRVFGEKLKQLNLESLFYNIEMPLTQVLFDMEISGFKIDVAELTKLSEKYQQTIENLTQQIYDVAGYEFNINSPKQVSDLLFEKLGINAYNNKKNSTNVDILNEIAHKHVIVPLIIEYRKVTKLYTTYINAFLQIADSSTHKIHTLFNQTLTATGRLSSVEPNLQNIPIRTEEGKAFRKVFIPSYEDGYIVTADYSQIELRLLANFSKDQKLINAFNNGEDIHATTASEIFGVPLSQVSSSMRRDAKAINFGIIYGISGYGLSQNINTTPEVAKSYINRYFEKYPTVKQYIDSNVEFCKQKGYAQTYFGRIRFIPEIYNSNYNLRNFGERAAMNMPLQGTASDIIKLAMVKVFNEFNTRKLKSKLILQIHDELLVDCAKDELIVVKEILQNCMENVVDLPVKLSVNLESGKNWFEAK